MKKKLALLMLGLGSMVAFSMYASNDTSVQQDPCYVEQCAPAPCYTDSTCNQLPCTTDTVCNPVPCTPAHCNPAPCGC